MSHFTCIVIGEDIEAQLAPFQENNMGDCPPDYMEFDDIEDASKAEYAGSTEMQKEYPTFEAYMSNYHGLDAPDEGKERYGYWSNPQAKWDWYTIGGRWSGFFKVKEHGEGIVGESGVFGNEAKEGYADVILKRNIDLDGHLADLEAGRREIHKKVIAAIDGHPPLNTFKEIVEANGENVELARAVYHAQPALAAMHEAKIETWGGCPVMDYCLREPDPEEAYIKSVRAGTMTPFAFIKDGEWVASGDMGWFGCSSADDDATKWNEQWHKLFNSLPDDTLLTVVDCHI